MVGNAHRPSETLVICWLTNFGSKNLGGHFAFFHHQSSKLHSTVTHWSIVEEKCTVSVGKEMQSHRQD